MITIQDLVVQYGSLRAVDRLTLNIDAGEVFGFIGPNGAGKSTTMKVLCALIRPTSGTALVDGLDVSRPSNVKAVRRTIGYMPDFLGVYDDLTVSEYLQFFAAAFGIPRSRRLALVDQLLELTDLLPKKNAMVDSLSRGMQQRLGIARVLVHDPKVLLLDEPASGLDPHARIEMRSLLKELARMGKTIMLSSHILSELDEMCTSIGIVERGRLKYAGSIEDAHRAVNASSRVRIRFREEPTRGAALFADDPRIQRCVVNEDALELELPPGTESQHFLLERLAGSGLEVLSFTNQESRLEDVFVRLTKGDVQ
jgi:ABC-2 type transport system ATP-binding protein